MKKYFLRVVLALLCAVFAVFAAFFLDRAFVRYSKAEAAPAELLCARAFFEKLVSDAPESEAEAAEMLGGAAKNSSGGALNIVRGLKERLKGFAGGDFEIRAYPASAWVKNRNLADFSEQVYDRKVFISLRKIDETERDSLENPPAALLMLSVDSGGKIDLPITLYKF